MGSPLRCAVLVIVACMPGCGRDWNEFVIAAATGGESAGGSSGEATGGSGAAASGGAGGTATGGSGDPTGGSGGEATGGTGNVPEAGSGGEGAGTGGEANGGELAGGSGGIPAVGGCLNGVIDGNESDVDCGGVECYGCLDGRACYVDADCRSQRCESGTCMPTSCSDNRVNGDETDIDCGGPVCEGCTAGLDCELDRDCAAGPQATGVCSGETCVLQCETGWDDCTDSAQGCETNTASDPDNCGFCGTICSDYHTPASCNEGSCAVDCDPGWADCDEDVLSGCETETTSDEAHCGDCDTACDARSICFQGACCPAIEQNEQLTVEVGTCFRVKPERCDCQINLLMEGGTGPVSAEIFWDTGGSIEQTWSNPGAIANFLPQSAFTVVITATEAVAERQFGWWTSECGGALVPCDELTQ